MEEIKGEIIKCLERAWNLLNMIGLENINLWELEKIGRVARFIANKIEDEIDNMEEILREMREEGRIEIPVIPGLEPVERD